MKKFSIILCAVILCATTMFGFAACGNDKLPDFKNCKVGYQLEVYPKVAFDYKISEDCIVHIESITATLTAKNDINEGDIITKPFYPYEVTMVVTGKVVGNAPINPFNPDEINLWVDLSVGGFPRITIDKNGEFESTCVAQLRENSRITFVRVRS